MSETIAILLAISLTLFSAGSALAQYQDPRLAGQVDVNDDLEAIYDAINAQARQKPPGAEKPVRDRRAYNQFMDQTAGNLNVEQANTARAADARRKDALITGSYEQRKINELAAAERAQVLSTSPVVSRDRRVYSGSPATAEFQSIDGRRQLGLSQSQDNVTSRLQDNQAMADRRNQALEDSANNLRDQVIDTQSSSKQFGLQGVGTNLYVRQYGRPEANLPPVHNAAARIVPRGGGDN
jgi:hypothetical protein